MRRYVKETGADYRSVNPSTLASQGGVEKWLKRSGEPMLGHITKNKDSRKQEPSGIYMAHGYEEWAEGWGDEVHEAQVFVCQVDEQHQEFGSK